MLFPAQSALHSSLVTDWKSSLPGLSLCCVIDSDLAEIIRQRKYFSNTWRGHLALPTPSIPQQIPRRCMAALAVANRPGQKPDVCVCVCCYCLSVWIIRHPVLTPVTSAMTDLPANENTHSNFSHSQTHSPSVSAFLYTTYTGYSSPITLLLSFSIKLSIAGRQCWTRNRDRDRPLSFHLSIDGVSNVCHACLDSQPSLTVSVHYFTIYLSNSLNSAV